MCTLKMKVILCTLLIALLATVARAEAVNKSEKVLNIEDINKDKEVVKKLKDTKEVHKRGIFHNEGLGHYATYPQFAQQAVWPKSYAAQYAYSFRPVGLSPSGYKHKPFYAPSYVLRPGGASVSSYSATYPRYHARPAYTVPHFAAPIPVQPIAPAVIQHIQPSFSVPHVATPLPAAPPPAAPAPPQQQHQYFVQTQFVPPTPVQAPLFTAQQAIPQYPPIAFSPETPTFLPSLPQTPVIPQVPPVPNVPVPPTPPPSNVIFPFNFQPPGPQQPPSFGQFPVGAEFPNFSPVGQNPVDSGSAVASPQIPAPPQPQAPLPEPELPPLQSPPTQSQTPWRPISQTPTVHQPRPPITLQPPYGAPSSGYLPPAAASQFQSQVQQYQVNENIYDELSDAEIENIFQQAKYVPYHSQHLQRQSGLVYQHHY